jgi:hypothetical protein
VAYPIGLGRPDLTGYMVYLAGEEIDVRYQMSMRHMHDWPRIHRMVAAKLKHFNWRKR